MAKFRTAVSLIFLGACATAAAQTPGMGDTRASSAAKKEPPGHEAQKAPTGSSHELKRCDEVSGTQREDCLRELRAAEGRSAAGATRRPEPPTAPPPNNPR